MGIINTEYNVNFYNNGNNYYISAPNLDYGYVINSDMSNFANGCSNLYLNLNNFNVNFSNVNNLSHAFCNCQKVAGTPFCSNNVTNMCTAFNTCTNLTGSPVCGDNVTNMHSAYINCNNLTGSPVCGNNVTGMNKTYYNCTNLTGSPVCGDKVTNMWYTYYCCYNLQGTMEWLYNNTSNNSYTLVNCANMFRFHHNNKQINIYCKPNSAVNNRLWMCNQSASNSIFGAVFTWTTMDNGYYNSAYNIYVYYNH